MSSKTKLSDQARHLALVPLFGQLDDHELAKLSEEVDQVFFKSDEPIFHEHDQGDALYVVESGAVRIWVHDEDVQQIGAGDIDVAEPSHGKRPLRRGGGLQGKSKE